jgi:hypothetical protein
MTAPTFLDRRPAERPVSETLRAIADRLDALPAHLPDPAVTVYQGADPTVSWHGADAETARAVMAALPGEWEAWASYITRPGDGAIHRWVVHLATVETEQTVTRSAPVADPATLVAESSEVSA